MINFLLFIFLGKIMKSDKKQISKVGNSKKGALHLVTKAGFKKCGKILKANSASKKNASRVDLDPSLRLMSRSFLLEHDHILIIQGEHTLQQLSVSLRKRGFSITDRASLIDALISHLSKALVTRATTIESAAATGTSSRCIVLGINLNPLTYFASVDKGPKYGSPESADFRQFWSGKSELRHAGGEVRETLVWRGSHVSQRVIDWVLRQQLGCRIGQYRQLHCQLRPLLQPSRQHHSTWSSAVANLNASLAELSSRLTSICNSTMPLGITGLLAVSPAFRGACLLPPPGTKLFPLLLECHVQLETSGKWPALLTPFRAMKTLFCLKLAQTMRSCLPRNEASSIVACRSGVLVTWRYQHRFYLRLALPKEAVLARQAGLPDAPVADLEQRSQRQQQQQRQQLVRADCAESRQLERDLTIQPTLAGALRGLTSQRPTHSETVRLCLRWLAGHMLLGTAVEPLAAELLCAWVALNSMHCSAMRGFLLVLKLLAEHDFQAKPLIVNLNESLSAQDRAEIEVDFQKRRRHLPAMFLACPQERTDSVFTSAKPDSQLLARLRLCARSTLNALDLRLTSGSSTAISAASLAATFTPAPETFDALLHLTQQPPFVEFSVERLRAGDDISVEDEDLINSNRLSPGFNWVEQLLHKLTAAHGRQAHFLADCYGGRVIGVLLRPDCAANDVTKLAASWIDTVGLGLVDRVEIFRKSDSSRSE